MERWTGRTALVTGASAGIGRAITLTLLNHGLNVVACARRIDQIEAIKAELTGERPGELMAVKCDLRNSEEIMAMFEKIKASPFKGIDVCVNNAGFGNRTKLSEGETAVWKDMLSVNVLALSICTRETLKSMKERNIDDGHIIHISSLGGHSVGQMMGFYCATKWAVRALTEGLRQELAAEKSGIRVTAISPGAVETEFGPVMVGKELMDEYLKVNPYLLSDDIVSAIKYALSAPPHVQIHDVLIHPIGQPK